MNPCCHHQCSQHPDAVPAVAGPSLTASFWRIHGHYSRWLTPAGIRSSCWKKPHPGDAPEKHPVPENADEKKKHTRTLQDAERSLAQARLSARRLALRHVEKSQIVTTDALSENESELLQPEGPPFHLCAFCHAWHCLNGYAAAQGVMVWLPDLHPASVVALNARALKEIFSDERKRVRQGRAVLNALVQNRLAVEEKFRTWRPADFADALRRWPPAQRKTLREKMDGVALILLPDSFPDKKYVM